MIDNAANNDLGSFTGHIDDSATGLTYMQARYYDPVMGRFLSNDPVGFAPNRPEYFNRYVYVGNDSVNMTAPTAEHGVAGFLIGVGLEVARQAVTGLGRGVAELSTSIAVRAGGNAVAGAAVGAANQVVNNTIDGKAAGDGVDAAVRLQSRN